MVRLHARACQITGEIITLMENGFADGAMARWRTLYEIGVVATVITDGGEDVAQRYLDHEAVESKFGLDEYARCHEALGFKPLSVRERRRVDRAYEEAVNEHGPDFGKRHGWAAAHLKLKKVTFRDLERAAQHSAMRSYYKMASYNVHAESKAILHRLGVLGDQSLILAGASDAGFVEPGQNTAVTLVRITGLLLSDQMSNLDVMMRMQLLLMVRDEMPAILWRADRKLQRNHAKLQGQDHIRQSA